jgi:hypothetical protein
MAVRRVYSEAEKKMLATFEEEADMQLGWAKSLRMRVAYADSMLKYGGAVDYYNPLYCNEEYAANTRWGGLIAVPGFHEFGMQMFILKPYGTGYWRHWLTGEDFEFFKPIRVNDSIKIWHRRPQLKDITDLDGKGPRKWWLLVHDYDYLNQKDELICTYKHYFEYIVLPERPTNMESIPYYKYTKEELEFIKHIEDEEEIRGANIRYWEDVKVGEKLTPVILGPTTFQDNVRFIVGGHGGGGGHGGSSVMPPMRELRRKSPETLITDETTGVTYQSAEWHVNERLARLDSPAGDNQHAFLFGALVRQVMIRLVTNWMGDDGFLRGFKWRHLARTPISDTIIGRGEVIRNYVENGEHLVDLKVWLDNVRGNVTEAAVATVSLLSKDGPYLERAYS